MDSQYKPRSLREVSEEEYVAGSRLRFSERAAYQVQRAYFKRKEVAVRGNALLAEGFAEWLRGRSFRFWRDDRPIRVLDVGAGGGALTSLFILHRILEAGCIPYLVLLDITLETLQATRSPDFSVPPGMKEEYFLTDAYREFFPFAPCCVGDAVRLPFESGVFDAVVSGFTHHHIKHKRRAASEMERVIKRGGFLGVVDFCPTPCEEREYHARNEREGAPWVPESFLALSRHVRLFSDTRIVEQKRLRESHLFWGVRKQGGG